MVSAWWLLAAFLTGTYTGVAVMAMMHMAARSAGLADDLPDLELERMSP